MSDSFDPYHRWLGIAPRHQPADYYRLLGIDRFEADPEVIADAAERQIAHVRRYQLGRHLVARHFLAVRAKRVYHRSQSYSRT